MRCFDAGIATLVALVALWLMSDIDSDGNDYLFLILIGSLLLPAVGELIGLYQPWRGRSLYTMLGIYLATWIATIGLLSLLLVAIQGTQSFSRLWMGVSALSVLAVGSVMRTLLYGYLRHLRAKGHNLKRVLLIGKKDNIVLLERKIVEMPHAGYVVVGHYVDEGDATFFHRIAVFAKENIFQRGFDEIWLGYPLIQGNRVRHLMRLLAGIPSSIRFFPDLPDIRFLNHRIAQVAGLYSLELNYTPLNGPMRLIKALEDRVLGLVLFVIFLPVMLVVAVAVKWSMGGPVLFKQERHGLDGKRFRIYKFRTMLLHDGSQTKQALYRDERITPLGRFLRRTSLDELPQLYNVLQGRMSLVGPRPHAMDHNDHYKDHIDIYMQRHRVKPGMTGWAQVNGLRGITDDVKLMEKRVEYDLYYIERWSLGFDLKILTMTLTKGFVNGQP
ncbi:MAG TPA: undecaprenyl-phosphate glucose phosphotransferase [Halomonas sp.]|uniref:Undecaprenyl-phosphate glucose phosphotransferase n=1 Tax=Halomonas campaniensis TaxID=213554 RepID=A0A3D0KH09_9GAMM|nr:undecaprenyl-phosphate glucose phosphotransferase [Halomonas sp.]HBS82727.1 undecaprenyl-phosphate glucose phosphotransferase [Halomonas campaniensis]HCA02852.1 undecaprenyl-phosphate glucose phosphotransferase [Halomonas campaniensis]